MDLLLVAAFAFGNLRKISVLISEIRISLLDLTVLLLYLVAFLKSRPSLAEVIKYRPIAFFSIVAFISLILSGTKYGIPALAVGLSYLVRWTAYSLLPLVLHRLFPSERLIKLMLWVGISLVVASLGQYLLFPDIRPLAIAEWDPHYFRVVGSLLDPGYTGLLLVFFLVFTTLDNQLATPKKNILWILTYVAFALTYSRSAYLAFLAAMTYISIKRRSWKFLVQILLLFTITLYLLPRSPDGEGVKLERTSSVNARLVNWQRAFTIFSDHPVLGVGFNVYRYAQHEYGYEDGSKWLKSHAGAGADSSLLFVAATTGIIGVVFYIRYLHYLYNFPNLRFYVFPLLVHSLFLNSLFYPFALAWISLALSRERTPPSLSDS